LKVENSPDRSELVRCIACHRLYELAFTTTGTKAETACPDCGAASWLAARIPIEESAASSRQ
jgi:rRNA maturation endonuclease Nob1